MSASYQHAGRQNRLKQHHMGILLSIIKTSLSDFDRNKLRTFLTSLGILIGVSSVILLVSLGVGLKNYITEQFENLGSNILIAMPGQIFGGDRQMTGGNFSGITFTEKDYLAIAKVSGIKAVAPAYVKTVSVSFEGKTEIGSYYGTTAEIFPMRNLEAGYGQIFSAGDVEKRKKIIVVGPKIAEKLFGNMGSFVGKTVKIEDQGFKVSGILKSKGGGGFGGPDFDSFLYVPYKSSPKINQEKKFSVINFQADSETVIDTVKESVTALLERSYDEEDFSVIEQTQIQETVTSIFAILNGVLVAIAAISLIVGGIGIMNIMYITVTERIREIGIRRAMGATRRNILSQFLFEAVFLSFIGGSFGLIVSLVIVFIGSRYFPLAIDLMSVVVALTVLSPPKKLVKKEKSLELI